MLIQISLVAGSDDDDGSEVIVETATAVDTADPRWATALVDTVTYHAQEGARRLAEQIVPQLPPADGFVPLADVAPAVAAYRTLA
jgi:hypothetical protein